MAYYNIRWKKSAIKELRNLPREYIVRIIHTIDELKKNPFPHGIHKLAGSERTYRIRVGNYRIIYEVMRNELIIVIIRIRHRKDVYKK